MRSDYFEDDEFRQLREPTWFTFNDFHKLNKRRIPNIFYFHMKRSEFEQIAGLLDGTAEASAKGSEWAIDRNSALTELEQKMRTRYAESGERRLRVTVSLFAGFVFLLPVILNYMV